MNQIKLNQIKEELLKIDTIICCSGDGTVHEVINGFLQRKDRMELVLKVGCLPAGSANCLLFNALKESKKFKLSAYVCPTTML